MPLDNSLIKNPSRDEIILSAVRQYVNEEMARVQEGVIAKCSALLADADFAKQSDAVDALAAASKAIAETERIEGDHGALLSRLRESIDAVSAEVSSLSSAPVVKEEDVRAWFALLREEVMEKAHAVAEVGVRNVASAAVEQRLIDLADARERFIKAGNLMDEVRNTLALLRERMDAVRDGAQGERGADGPRGPVGDQGPRGEQGDQGPQGARGDPGPAGDRGEKGDQGPQGDRGDPGPAGDRGEKGEQGHQGPRGDPGPSGERGEKGDRGADGSLGEILTWKEGAAWKGTGVGYRHRGGLWMAVADPEGSEPGTDDRWRCVADGVASIEAKQDDSDPRTLRLSVAMSSGHIVNSECRLFMPLFKGLWSEAEEYEQGDVVQKNGGAWIALTPSVAALPGECAAWALMAKQGKPGPKGEAGPKGERGSDGKDAGIKSITREGQSILIEKTDGTFDVVPLGIEAS